MDKEISGDIKTKELTNIIHAKRPVIKKSVVNCVIKTFFDVLIDELIHEETEYVFNPLSGTDNRASVRIGYIVKSKNPNKNPKLKVNYLGMSYLVRIKLPKKAFFKRVPRNCKLLGNNKQKLVRELKRGRRYFNSYKDEILYQR